MDHGIWIWENSQAKNDEYADFRETFTLDSQENVSIKLSSDSNYAVYVNGALAAFGQYADFPHCKVADTHDITPFCRPGENELLITVWYYGVSTSTYYPGQAGLYFEITAANQLLAVSGTHTQCRKNPCFVPYREKWITKEQGFSFFYDANRPQIPYHDAVATGFSPQLLDRPILTLTMDDLCPGTIIGGNGSTHFLLDLGREEVGYLELSLESDVPQTVTVTYAEHLVDGYVQHLIGKRDFSAEYGAVVGKNHYLNPFRRMACRYMEVHSEYPIRLHYAGIRPTVYPVTELPFDAGSPRRQQIYEAAKRTLRLCMHEHYEDCPWREQALYAMDSRNQMLSGYYAFGETRFARASLWLLGQDRREDGFLTDVAPSDCNVVIPSFCLHWYLEVLEYTEFSGDLTLAEELWDKLCSVLDAFMGYFDTEKGLLRCLPNEKYWNFYEWSGRFLMGTRQDSEPDLLLNCLFLRALDIMAKLSQMTDLPFRLGHMVQPLRQQIRASFRDENGLYWSTLDKTHICQLGQAFAVLTGVAQGEDAKRLCRVMTDTEKQLPVEIIQLDPVVLTKVDDRNVPGSTTIRVAPVSLSMSAFVYDALLMVDKDAYTDYILSDIDQRCGTMLDAGSTTFWEIMNGWQAFGGAGSLCHGWSGIAAYYYHKLL